MTRRNRFPLLAALVLAGMCSATPGWADATQVRIETEAGNIVVQLDSERAPLSVKNFLEYAREGFYDGTVFHRVVNGFVIQGGGYDEKMTLKPVRPGIPNESGNGLSNRRGTIAMARNRRSSLGRRTVLHQPRRQRGARSEADALGLRRVRRSVEGMEVVDDIGHRATVTRDQLPDVPAQPVLIKRVVVLSGAAP